MKLRYLLDTDSLVYIMKGKMPIVEKVKIFEESEYAISIITHSEIQIGMNYQDKRSKRYQFSKKLLDRLTILKYEVEESVLFGEISAKLAKKGQRIENMNAMIAATAIINNLILVTNNTKHYSRIEGLKLDNWML